MDNERKYVIMGIYPTNPLTPYNFTVAIRTVDERQEKSEELYISAEFEMTISKLSDKSFIINFDEEEDPEDIRIQLHISIINEVEMTATIDEKSLKVKIE